MKKHAQPGGRARQFTTENGYVFDMGPSWYWMPDILKAFSPILIKSLRFFELISLNPQFEMIFSDETIGIPEDFEELKNLFESIEKVPARNWINL